MGRNCARALENGPRLPGVRAVFKSKGTVSPNPTDAAGKQQIYFFTQNNKTPSNAALPFQFFIENILKLKLFVHAIQFCTREI